MIETIKKTIETAIPGCEAFVQDPNRDGEHFQALVVSSTFVGMSLVKQHQQVMRSLKEAFAQSVHALALKTFTPEQWEREEATYL